MKIGIIGAMTLEIEKLKEQVEDLREVVIGELIYYEGILKGRDIVLAKCGIGKVNGGICATLMITYFKVEKIIFTGIAGGLNPSLGFGDIVISRDLVQHDFDTTVGGGLLGKVSGLDVYSFEADKIMVDIASEEAIREFGKERVYVGRILSGDQLIGSRAKVDWLRETFEGECTEMEGAAVAQVCYLLGTPFVVIRSISDMADEKAVEDYDGFGQIAADNSRLLVERIIERI